MAVTNADNPVPGRCPGTCDATGTCKSKQGQPCNTVTGTSGGCLGGLSCSPDNYCCNRACTGSCEACDLATAPGTCTTVTDSPHVGHSSCAGSVTACNGTCAGSTNGQCVWATGSCGQTSCANLSGNSGTTYVGQGTCSSGTCGAGLNSSCSADLLCASTQSCKTGCSVDGDCIAGDYCNAGACTPKSGNGGPCTSGNQCSTGACIDGVCCENSCPALCMACSSTKTGNTNGLCRAVKTGTDPDNECAVDSANTCGQDGTCDGSGSCRLQANGISCGSSSCSVATITPAGKCNGTGTCIPASSSNMCPANFTCASGTSCGTTCSERSTGGCTLGNECLNGSCIQATVPCGSGVCAVANGSQGCCATDPSNTGTNAVYTCLPPGATCTTLSNILCNGMSDCPTGQYCCIAGNGCSPSHWNAYCTANVSACVGSSFSFGYQVCDPSIGGGSECVTGSCQSDSSCVQGLFVCR